MGQNALKAIRRHDVREQVSRLVEIFDSLMFHGPTRADRGEDIDVVLYAAERPWDPAVRQMLDRLARVQTRASRRILICRMDLCDEETLEAAKVMVLPDGPSSLLPGVRAMRAGIPLIVSQFAQELAEACRESRAGLVYADDDELEACVELLLTDEPLRRAIGARGRQFVCDQAAEVAGPVRSASPATGAS